MLITLKSAAGTADKILTDRKKQADSFFLMTTGESIRADYTCKGADEFFNHHGALND